MAPGQAVGFAHVHLCFQFVNEGFLLMLGTASRIDTVASGLGTQDLRKAVLCRDLSHGCKAVPLPETYFVLRGIFLENESSADVRKRGEGGGVCAACDQPQWPQLLGAAAAG